MAEVVTVPTLFLTLMILIAIPRPTNSFSIAYLQREIKNWIAIFETNVAGPQVIRNTQIWNFHPQGGIARRQRFQEQYGPRGQNLVNALSHGEKTVDALTGRYYKGHHSYSKIPNKHLYHVVKINAKYNALSSFKR